MLIPDRIRMLSMKVLGELEAYREDENFPALITTLIADLDEMGGDDRNTYPAILRRTLARIDKGFDTRKSSPIFNTLSPSAYELGNMDKTIRIFKEQVYLLTATGSNLDRYGASFTLPRYGATQAVRIAETRNTQGELWDFPVGTRFMTIDPDGLDPNPLGIWFELIATQGGRALLRCEIPGTIGHGYFGAILPGQTVNNFLAAEIVGTEIPGQDTESDESYRERLIEHLARTPYGGNIPQYVKWVKAIEGAGNCVVFPAWLAGSTVKICVVDTDIEAVTTDFLHHVKEVLDPLHRGAIINGILGQQILSEDVAEFGGTGEGVVPIGHDVTMSTPEYLDIDIAAEVTLRPGFTQEQAYPVLRQAVERYIDRKRRQFIRAWRSTINRGEASDGTTDGLTVEVIEHTPPARPVIAQDTIFSLTISWAVIIAELINTGIVTDVSEDILLNGARGNIRVRSGKWTQRLPRLGEFAVVAS